jgi:hypothetical protein
LSTLKLYCPVIMTDFTSQNMIPNHFLRIPYSVVQHLMRLV